MDAAAYSQVPHAPPSYPSSPLLPQTAEKQQGALPAGRVAVVPGYAGYDAIYIHGSPMPLPGSFTPHPRRSRSRRLIVRAVHMLMLLAVFVLLFPSFMRSIARVAHAIHEWRSPTGVLVGEPDLPSDCKEVLDWTILDHFPHHIMDDVELGHDRYAARTSVKLPVSSDLLYFISRGSLSHGAVRIIDDGEDSSDVNVSVTFVYDAEFLLDRAKVCLLQQEHDKNGVGIFSPNWRHNDHHHRTSFFVDIHLPAKSESSPLQIRGLKTDMPLFRHSVADLAESVHFDSLTFSTSNMPIDAESLSADFVDWKSSNGPITGNFVVKDTLEIHTTNSPISANISLLNDGKGPATNVSLVTSNSPLRTNISMIATTDDEDGSAFNVLAHTSNSPLHVAFVSAPVDSLLHFDGATSNSPAHAALHATYEGAFTLRGSTFFQPRVEQRADVEDPTGAGRKRNVLVRSVARGVVQGDVYWEGDKDKALGSVQLRSSNMPVTLLV